MNHNLLLSWLGLPPGPWPPDDRTLLGLAAGPIDPFAAEKRALDLMERLRPHQLVHPDLVTEGMNRLAQALVAVSSMPAAPPPPPKPAPKPAAPKPAPKPAAPGKPAAPAFEAVDFALPTPGAAPPPNVMDAEVVEAEVVEAEVVEAEVVEAEVVAAPARTPRRRRPPANLPPLSFALPAAADFVPPKSRRQAYRELAGLRQLRRAWRRLRASVADPGEPLLGPAEVCGFLEAVAEVRAVLARPELTEGRLGAAGGTVRALVRQPLALSVFRSLRFSQRRSVAGDWAAGWAAIEGRSMALRRHLRDTRPPRTRVTAGGVGRWVAGNPEWLLAAATVAALGTAAAR